MYVLTNKGRELYGITEMLGDWVTETGRGGEKKRERERMTEQGSCRTQKERGLEEKGRKIEREKER